MEISEYLANDELRDTSVKDEPQLRLANADPPSDNNAASYLTIHDF